VPPSNLVRQLDGEDATHHQTHVHRAPGELEHRVAPGLEYFLKPLPLDLLGRALDTGSSKSFAVELGKFGGAEV